MQHSISNHLFIKNEIVEKKKETAPEHGRHCLNRQVT